MVARSVHTTIDVLTGCGEPWHSCVVNAIQLFTPQDVASPGEITR
jgi:hypothetical protein